MEGVSSVTVKTLPKWTYMLIESICHLWRKRLPFSKVGSVQIADEVFH